MKDKVAVIVGSNRKGSINRKLALALTRLGADRFEFEMVEIDGLPMYDQDLEAEKPAAVTAFVGKVKQFKSVLVVTPEYNRSIPAVLKNAIDWASRPGVGGNAFKGQVIATAGTTPSALGTAMAQEHLRHIFGILGATVLGGEVYVQMKDGLIDDVGNITNPDTEKFLAGFIDRFADLSGKAAA